MPIDIHVPEIEFRLVEVIALQRFRDRNAAFPDGFGVVVDLNRIDPAQLVRFLERPGTPIRVTADRLVCLTLRRGEDSLAEAFGLLDLLAPAASGDIEDKPAAEREAR